MTQTPIRRPLDAAAAQALQQSLAGWQLAADGRAISRRFAFRDFDAAVDFVNRLAVIANRRDHHPDLKVGWGYCEVLYTTHDAGGLTALDGELARETQALFDSLPRG